MSERESSRNLDQDVTADNRLSRSQTKAAAYTGFYRRVWEENLQELMLVFVLIGLVAVLGSTSHHFLSLRNLNAILAVSAFIGIIGVGQTFVMISGGIDLSIGYVSGFGGVLCALLLKSGLSAALAIPFVLLVGGGIGLFNGLVITRLRVNDFITTLSTMTIAYGMIYTATKGNSVPIDSEFVMNIGYTGAGIMSFPVIAMIVLFVVSQIALSRARFGRHIYAVGGSLRAARLAGINTERVKIMSYMISGVLCSWVGILVAGRLNTAQPQAGSGFLFDVITAVVLGGVSLAGGTGTLVGTFLGVLLIAVLDNGVTMSGLPYYYQSILKGLLLIGAIAITNRRLGQSAG